MGQFFSHSKTLRGCYGPLKVEYHFLTLGCSAKPILDYVTTGLFGGPLSVNLPDFKKWQISVALIILNFDPQICTKM